MVTVGDFVILEGTRENGLSIRKDDFESLFGAADTYENLCNHENADWQWKKQFDIMKAQGLLN